MASNQSPPPPPPPSPKPSTSAFRKVVAKTKNSTTTNTTTTTTNTRRTNVSTFPSQRFPSPSAPFPESISDLCAATSHTYSSILLNCLYCSKPLSSLEAVFFDLGQYKLVWSNGSPSAACSVCLKLVAKFELLVSGMGCLNAAAYEHATGCRLETLGMRCLICLRQMPREEIGRILLEDDTVHIVDDQPRAACTLCKLGMF
ncbi:early protein E6 [Tadarida brasiliensis papillomavirus 1]|uniref:Protein E6 n=1 Tax=Tadarida brasiliensis papillomavirus 1 TaxID=2664215 RepID=A0A5Q2F330_9PAPI|nr:early protein E6 [Tadarida brasiliensis papillomavirus 1]